MRVKTSYHRKKGKDNPQSKFDRNQQIIKLAETKIYSGEELARMFGITRERVRQIYKKMTGKAIGKERQEFFSRIRSAKKERHLNSVNFTCLVCKKEVTFRENQYGNGKYCKSCISLSNKYDYTVWVKCSGCGKKFHPFRNHNTPSVIQHLTGKYGRFCTRDCYWSYLRKIGNFPSSRNVSKSLVDTFLLELKQKA